MHSSPYMVFKRVVSSLALNINIFLNLIFSFKRSSSALLGKQLGLWSLPLTIEPFCLIDADPLQNFW